MLIGVTSESGRFTCGGIDIRGISEASAPGRVPPVSRVSQMAIACSVKATSSSA